MIECKVNRYFGHFEGDAQRYRAPDEVKGIREKSDCITNLAARVTANGMLDLAELERIGQEMTTVVDDAVTQAKAATKPVAQDLLTDVYVSY